MDSLPKKIGAVVLATDQGLGYLAKDFYDNGIIDVVYVKPHSSRTNHYEWYPNRVDKPEDLFSCDTLLFFEDVFFWKLIPQARERNIKTVLIPMYECTRNPLPYQPDLILSPSELDKLYYPDSTVVTIPVTAKWRLRKKAEVFVHNAGNGGIGGRNGTKELLEAMQYVKSPIKLILRSQVPIDIPDDPRIDLRIGTFEDIWSEGDVFVFPEKFNGLSLPIQEAYASGMLIMTSNRLPNNLYLPTEPLIPVKGYKTERIAVEFDSAVIDPKDIAQTIDSWYNKDIESFSLVGKAWGEQNSWKSLKKTYLDMLQNVLR